MIFVVLGTQDKSFQRLLIALEDQIQKKKITKKVIVQAGHTKYTSKYMKILDFISIREFNEYIKQSDLIITHGGVGTILDALKQDKKIIATPRLKEYGEHENNHQLQIIKKFEQEGYLLACYNLDEIGNIMKKVKEFKPKKYVGNNQKMIQILKNYIDQI